MKLSIYDFTSPVQYLIDLLRHRDKGSRGLRTKMATAMGVSLSMVSSILSGRKQLNQEQANDLAEFLGLNENETDFFLLLVDYDRAGNHRLKTRLLHRIQREKSRAQKISARVEVDRQLTEIEKSIFYSSWLYSGIRILASTPQGRSRVAISNQLQIPLSLVNQITEFLLKNNLCIETKRGIDVGPRHTHLDSDSPFINKHRQNWRIRAMQKMDMRKETDLFYVCPMSLSKQKSAEVRSRLLDTISEILKEIKECDPEETRCLNIDWFDY